MPIVHPNMAIVNHKWKMKLKKHLVEYHHNER